MRSEKVWSYSDWERARKGGGERVYCVSWVIDLIKMEKPPKMEWNLFHSMFLFCGVGRFATILYHFHLSKFKFRAMPMWKVVTAAQFNLFVSTLSTNTMRSYVWLWTSEHWQCINAQKKKKYTQHFQPTNQVSNQSSCHLPCVAIRAALSVCLHKETFELSILVHSSFCFPFDYCVGDTFPSKWISARHQTLHIMVWYMYRPIH